MIEKLHSLKKMQTDQKINAKESFNFKIKKHEAEILITKTQIDSASVQKFGAISDFAVLEMHKNTMRLHIQELEKKNSVLNQELELLIKDIIQLQKESEQFAYILEEQRQEAIKKILLAEEEEANEYIQSKYISR